MEQDEPREALSFQCGAESSAPSSVRFSWYAGFRDSAGGALAPPADRESPFAGSSRACAEA